MGKSDAVYKQAFNGALSIVAELGRGSPVPSETALSQRLAVSRTTVRKALQELVRRGLISSGRERVVTGRPKRADRFPVPETVATARQVERRFMEWMLRGDLEPGATINVLELARRFGVSTTALRDFLNGFARFGLIEKRPNTSWIFKGITPDFALELFEVRQMFELSSARAFIRLPPGHPSWAALEQLREEHLRLAAELAERYHDFSALDARFHQLVNDASGNRFIRDFYQLIAFIFHYHYQWNKMLERERNGVAIVEHLAYIDALMSRDWRRVEAAAGAHLATARTTLLNSLKRATPPAVERPRRKKTPVGAAS
ncbi:MAG TPA: GntR family transcriptional regulator [Devosiaceae bacterium]|nr:GntR family transcriptional regulator [Devosiaceae bacterium]